MFNKKLFNKYIDSYLAEKGMTAGELAGKIEMPPSNFTRARNVETNNQFSFDQFATLIELLELTPNQVYHLITGKKSKHAIEDRVARRIWEVVKEFQ